MSGRLTACRAGAATLLGRCLQFLALAFLGSIATMPVVANAGDTWKFVDGDGVLHIGNAVDADAAAGPASQALVTDPQEPKPSGVAREITLINRTWTMRYPAWEPAAATEAARSAFGPVATQGKAVRLPRGFGEVKPYLDAAAQSHAVDPALLYSVAAAESAFNTEAVSHKGAMGLMQIMPATAARYGVSGYSLRTGRHNVFEPQLNASIGTRYLADLIRMFDGDMSLAVAAYNAGEGAVSKYGNRIPPYPETQKYVERVMGYYRSFKQ